MTTTISRAEVVGGHDGRAEILVELTYDTGGTSTISVDEDACLASLDAAGIDSIDQLVGREWTVVLPALAASHRIPSHPAPSDPAPSDPAPSDQGGTHARSRHP